MRPEPRSTGSSLYTGVVCHRRRGPIRHAFRYRVAMLGLDLADPAPLRLPRPLWGYGGAALVSWRREDHVGDTRRPLDESVRDLVEERTGARPQGWIELVTTPRVLGYGFNPISLFLCHDRRGDLECVVAEVTSTPWGERHCYVLPVPESRRGQTVQRFVTSKRLHVSPFLGMRQEYRWRVAATRHRLCVGIVASTAEGRPFSATLSLRQRPLRAGALLPLLLQPPLGAAGTMAAIHFEAARLWWKGAPVHPHPGHQAGFDHDEVPAGPRPAGTAGPDVRSTDRKGEHHVDCARAA